MHTIEEMKAILIREVAEKRVQLDAMRKTLNDLVNLDNSGRKAEYCSDIFGAIADAAEDLNEIDIDDSGYVQLIVPDTRLKRSIVRLSDALANCWVELTEMDESLKLYTPAYIESLAIDLVDDEIMRAHKGA